MSKPVKLIVVAIVLALLGGAAVYGWKQYNLKKYATVRVALPIGQMSTNESDPTVFLRQLLEMVGDKDSVQRTVSEMNLAEYYGMSEEDAVERVRGRLEVGIADDGETVVIFFRDKSEEEAKKILGHLTAIYGTKLRTMMENARQQAAEAAPGSAPAPPQ